MTIKRQLFAIIMALALLTSHLPLRSETATDAVWIDVRTPTEYASGHLQNARLIPFDEIEVGIAALELDKDAPIYLYCAAGGRAEVAMQRLQAQGYSQVSNVGSLENARKLYQQSRQTLPAQNSPHQ